MQAAHSGWLEKHSGGKSDGKFRLGNTLGKWDRRYFVLDEGGTLSYYKSDRDRSPAGKIDCNGGAVEQDGRCLSIGTAARVLTLRAASEEDVVVWVCALAAFVDGGSAQPHDAAAGGFSERGSGRAAEEGDRAALGLSSSGATASGAKPFAADSGSNPFGETGGAPARGGGGGGDSNPFGGDSNPFGSTGSAPPAPPADSGGGGYDGGGGGGGGDGGGGGAYSGNPFATSAFVAELVE